MVARNNAEAELRSLAHGLSEILWLNHLVEELRILAQIPLKLFCDNKAAINISRNPVHHDITKHVEMDQHFIKEKVEDGAIYIVYIPTSSQVAIVLTKGIWKPDF